MRDAARYLRLSWAIGPEFFINNAMQWGLLGFGVGYASRIAGLGGWPIIAVSTIALPLAWLIRWLVKFTEPVSDQPFSEVVCHHTDRLTIRSLRQSDAVHYAESLDDEMVRTNGWLAGQRKTSIASMATPNDAWRQCHLIACGKQDGQPVAFASVTNTSPSGQWNIGFWVTPAHRGRGFAVEALTGVFQIVHESGIATAHIGTASDNAPMRAVIGRVGAEATGTRLHTLPDGTVIESNWYTHTVDDN